MATLGSCISFWVSKPGRLRKRRFEVVSEAAQEEVEVVQPLRERYKAHTLARPSLPHLDMSVRWWAVELSGVAASAGSALLYTGRKVCRLCGDHLKEGVPSDSNRTAANLPNVP
jgi:hypothetical protein